MLKTLNNSSTNYRYSLQHKSFDVISALQEKSTKWLFLALCFYILSQGFTIPLIPIGPWSTWPNLSDFATGLLVLTFLLNFTRKKPPASSANNKIFLFLIIILLASILSYLWYLSNLIDGDAPGIRLGIYQFYRIVQFICVFGVTAQIPLTPERINILKQITNLVLIFVCLSIILTFVGIVPLKAITAHLPNDPGTAGPWSHFALMGPNGGLGWGTIGYNHAYVAAQVTMLASLRMHLGLGKQVLFDFFLLFLSIFSCLISGSRAGFFSMIVFAAIYVLKKQASTGIAITMAILFLSVATIASLPSLVSGSNENPIIERQATLLDAGNTENLAGRDEYWVERIDFLTREPIRWIFGVGFGSAWDRWGGGESAHMLPLHIILENGIIGLLIFGVLFYKILYSLYRYEATDKAIYWATIALLLGSLTQETFYPVSAMGNFLGFYLCSVAIALQNKTLIDS
jgi:hypothetical protein